MQTDNFRAWARRRSTRAVAIAALVIGPIAAVPAIMATGASAAGSGTAASTTGATGSSTSTSDAATGQATGQATGDPTGPASSDGASDAASSPAATTGTGSPTDKPSGDPTTDPTGAANGAAPALKGAANPAQNPAAAADCGLGSPYLVYTFDGAHGTASVAVTDARCDGTEFSLASYSTPSLGATFPQTRTDLQSRTVTVADGTVTLSVTLPTCYAQVDLILGHDAPSTLTTWYFSTHNTLLGSVNIQNGGCIPTTPPTTPVTTPPTTPTTTPPTTPVTTPPTTPTCTPPATTPPSTTPPGGSTPPACSPPPCTTQPKPASCFSTPVLGFSTSVPPTYYYGGPTLPYTGANFPLRAGLLSAIGLLIGGAALILLAGRTEPLGSHRRR